MHIILGIISLIVFLIGSMRDASRSADLRSSPFKRLDDGTPVYLNLHGGKIIHGENCIEKSYVDDYGHRHTLTIGKNSKKIYEDSHDCFLYDQKVKSVEKWYKANKDGLLAYNKYNDVIGTFIKTEIATDKPIAALYKDTSKGIFRKFYLKNNSQINTIALKQIFSLPNDYGIPISYDDYNRLNIENEICSIYFSYVNKEVYELIGTKEDVCFGKENKYLFNTQHAPQRIGEKCKVYYYDKSENNFWKGKDGMLYKEGTIIGVDEKEYIYLVSIDNEIDRNTGENKIMKVKPAFMCFEEKDKKFKTETKISQI